MIVHHAATLPLIFSEVPLLFVMFQKDSLPRKFFTSSLKTSEKNVGTTKVVSNSILKKVESDKRASFHGRAPYSNSRRSQLERHLHHRVAHQNLQSSFSKHQLKLGSHNQPPQHLHNAVTSRRIRQRSSIHGGATDLLDT